MKRSSFPTELGESFLFVEESQVSPDSVAYTAAISACRRVKHPVSRRPIKADPHERKQRVRRWQHSLGLLEDMKESQALVS